MPPLGVPILTRCSRLYMTLHDITWVFLICLEVCGQSSLFMTIPPLWNRRPCLRPLWASAIWALPMASYGILWPCFCLWPSFGHVCASENPTSLLVLGAWNIPAARRAPTSSPGDAVACDINYTIYILSILAKTKTMRVHEQCIICCAVPTSRILATWDSHMSWNVSHKFPSNQSTSTYVNSVNLAFYGNFHQASQSVFVLAIAISMKHHFKSLWNDQPITIASQFPRVSQNWLRSGRSHPWSCAKAVTTQAKSKTRKKNQEKPNRKLQAHLSPRLWWG